MFNYKTIKQQTSLQAAVQWWKVSGLSGASQ